MYEDTERSLHLGIGTLIYMTFQGLLSLLLETGETWKEDREDETDVGVYDSTEVKFHKTCSFRFRSGRRR